MNYEDKKKLNSKDSTRNLGNTYFRWDIKAIFKCAFLYVCLNFDTIMRENMKESACGYYIPVSMLLCPMWHSECFTVVNNTIKGLRCRYARGLTRR